MDFRLRQHARLRAEALDNAAHERPDGGRGHQHRCFAVFRRLLEFFPHQVDEFGEFRRLHGEVAIVALADDRFGKGLLPFGGERDDRQRAGRGHVLGAELAREPGADMLGEHRGIARCRQPVGDAFEDGRQIADRHPLGEQDLQHALDTGNGDLRRHDVLDQLALLLGQLLDQFLHLAVGQKLRHIGLDEFGEVRGEHRCGVDDGQALDRSLLL